MNVNVGMCMPEQGCGAMTCVDPYLPPCLVCNVSHTSLAGHRSFDSAVSSTRFLGTCLYANVSGFYLSSRDLNSGQ